MLHKHVVVFYRIRLVIHPMRSAASPGSTQHHPLSPLQRSTAYTSGSAALSPLRHISANPWRTSISRSITSASIADASTMTAAFRNTETWAFQNGVAPYMLYPSRAGAGQLNQRQSQRHESRRCSAAATVSAEGVLIAGGDAQEQSGSGAEVKEGGHIGGDPLEELSDEQRRQIDAFVDFLLQENEKMNLTAIKDRAEVYDRHVRDSLALLPVLDAHMPTSRSPVGENQGPAEDFAEGLGGPTLLDVGSGAGLPGILLAIARPHWQVTMLDTLRKRCDFVNAAATAVGLSNVKTLWMRAEDAGQDPKLRESYDVVTARAVAEMRMLAELCLPLTRVGGFWIAAKGAEPDEEVLVAMNAISVLGGELLSVSPVESESPKGPRTVAIVAKRSATPSKYPRKPKKLVKEPL